MGETAPTVPLSEVVRLVEKFATTARPCPVEVVLRVKNDGKPSADLFEERLNSLSQEKAARGFERDAYVRINQITARLIHELSLEVTSFEDMEREVALERCEELCREVDTQIERVQANAKQTQPCTAETQHQCKAEVAVLKRGLKEAIATIHERVALPPVESLSFSHDDRIVQRGVGLLKEWTGMTSAEVVYNSAVDEFTDDGLFEKVKGKPNIALIVFTSDEDVFGGFYSVAVTEQKKSFYDPNIFAFSLESSGRCITPQKFEVKDGVRDKANVFFYKDHLRKTFMTFWVYGVCGFHLGGQESNTRCWGLSRGFAGLSDTTLSGETNYDDKNPSSHHCRRLFAIQLS